MRLLVGTTATLALLGLACAPEQGETPPEEPVTETVERVRPFQLTEGQERGRQIFETVCWSCHGPYGRGDGPAVTAGAVAQPPSFITREYARLTPEQLMDRFSAALEGADPSHPHMTNVASFVRPERFADALAYVIALAYPPEVPGSALAGRDVYLERCVVCHGVDGTGQGWASQDLGDVRPANFTADTLIARRDFEGLFNRIKQGGNRAHGSYMPSWGIMFSDTQIWDLVAYVSGFQDGVLSDPPVEEE